jgi:hypothetical protein
MKAIRILLWLYIAQAVAGFIIGATIPWYQVYGG